MSKEKEPTDAQIPSDTVDENKDMSFPKKHSHFIVDKLKKIEKHNESLHSENNDLKEKVDTMTKELHIMSNELHTMQSESRKFQEEMRDSLRKLEQENQQLKHQIEVLTNEYSSKASKELNQKKIVSKDSKEPAIDNLKLKSPPKISMKETIAWDESQISRLIKLSNRNLTATNSADNAISSLSGAFLNFKCLVGKYSWTFRFDTRELWIFSGIIDEKNININSMSYDSSYGLSFYNYPENSHPNMQLEKQPKLGLQTFEYKLDMNEGIFEVYQNSDLIAKSCDGNFKGKSMRPFIILQRSQNTVTIVPESN